MFVPSFLLDSSHQFFIYFNNLFKEPAWALLNLTVVSLLSISLMFTLYFLLPSREFLISFIVLFIIVCVVFSSSMSLLNVSYIFSILFPRFWVIFAIITLNSFSGSLPISSSCIWSCEFYLAPFPVRYFSVFSFCLIYSIWGLLP